MADGSSPMITHCVCHDVSFARLRRYAEEHEDVDFETLRRRFGCGTGCGLCIPYVRAMLHTGRTAFEVSTEITEGAEDTGPDAIRATDR